MCWSRALLQGHLAGPLHWKTGRDSLGSAALLHGWPCAPMQYCQCAVRADEEGGEGRRLRRRPDSGFAGKGLDGILR